MVKYKNLLLIGTSHIAIESVKEVENKILETKPDVVALELDRPRLQGLLQKKKPSGHISIKDIRRIGVKGVLFAMVAAWVEKTLGNYVGVKPGSEMVSAFHAAHKVSARVALVDQDISVTVKRLSSGFSWREKWNLFVDLIKGFVFRKKEISFDLHKVPSQKIVDELIGKVKKRYPTLYRVLVKERNEVMAKNLYSLMQKFENIIAVVGAGHEEELIALIKKEEKIHDRV